MTLAGQSSPAFIEAVSLRWCYSILGYLLLPLLYLRLWWRSLALPAYRQRWRERLALYRSAQLPESSSSCVIFHAVSVGEVHAAEPLVNAFRKAHPGISIVVTTSTPTGSERVRKLFGNAVTHVYLPWDLPGAIKRFLDHFNPVLMVLMETELWPNLLHACRKRGCRTALVNARLSARSMRGYQRLGSLTWFMLADLDLVAAQSSADAERFVTLGLLQNKLKVSGSLKFDVCMDTGQIGQGDLFKHGLSGRPVWIAASTRDGEEAKVLKAFGEAIRHLPDLLLVLVPRHPERFDAVAREAEAKGFSVSCYSKGGMPAADTEILLGDTMGQMAFYYALADCAFVGGSLVDTGCQNIIEPALLALPVLTGPSRFNFQAVSDAMLEAGGLFIVKDEHELCTEVVRLLQNETERLAAGRAALEVARYNQGATARVCALLGKLLPSPK